MDGRFVSVMRWRATPHCNRSCAGVASPGFFAARRAACARGHRTAAAPAKARLGPRASHSRAAWHPDPHAHVGARAMQPNTAQQHARAATRTGMAGDRRVCSLRGGRELPARAGLGINFGGDGGKLTPRAHAHAYADMRMPGRECKALELNPPRALLLARRKCDGLARAQPRRGRAAHAKTQRRPELPADLRLQGGVYMCAPLHHRNKPTIHSIMIVLSSPACIRAIMNAFMFHIGAA
jgi:hypothetical protein